MTKALLSVMVRPLIEPHLPPEITPHWFSSADEARAEISDAEIAWVDMNDPGTMRDIIATGTKLKWLSTIYAGLDHFPVQQLAAQGTTVTNGVGINTVSVAEYAVLGMLSLAKQYPAVVRAADRREWLQASPGTVELCESKALIIGYGAIGRAIGDRLNGFGVAVTGVARTARPDEGVIGANDWQDRINEFDWIVLALPATDETEAVFGAWEIAAMRESACLVNMARGVVRRSGGAGERAAGGAHRRRVSGRGDTRAAACEPCTVDATQCASFRCICRAARNRRCSSARRRSSCAMRKPG